MIRSGRKKINPAYLIFFLGIFFATAAGGQDTQKIFLSGTDKDSTVDWEFFCTGGRNSGIWTRIPVPSCWELQGFGTYNYGNDPEEARAKEQGQYRHRFRVPSEWKGSSVDIVFEGVMTDTEVKINGITAGERHHGGFYEFRYDISRLLNYGKENLLEVSVSKHSANESVNNAERRCDYWIFGGIFRPVYLESKPPIHIRSIAVDAQFDGNLNCGVSLSVPGKSLRLEMQLYDGDTLKGKSVSVQVPRGITSISLSEKFMDVKSWNPEFPALYRLEVILSEGSQVIHRVWERIGFRSVEVKEHDGIYINGTKIRFKGVCRHSFWPESGRTTSKKLSIDDVNLMKSMNMNAVRMSHYPPDKHFLEACDSLGLFVLDELAGWQHAYDTAIGKKLIREMVIRDVNHPSIVLWDNGNEGGWNYGLDDEFAKYDPQKREVIHPWENFRKTDTHHYIEYNYGTSDFFNGDQIFFPTEFLHGLYDGGLGAGLDDFWNLMLRKPLSAGGFLWVFSDESVVRTDRGGELDSDGNHAPDGILGPYREKEGSYYAIREIWSPVFFEDRIITRNFDGMLNIENRYDFTDLDQCRFSYNFIRFEPLKDGDFEERVLFTGDIESPHLGPGLKGKLKLHLPPGWENSDCLYITVTDPKKREVITWSRVIVDPRAFHSRLLIQGGNDKASLSDEGELVVMKGGQVMIGIEKSTGRLKCVAVGGKGISITNGPAYAGGWVEISENRFYSEGGNTVFEATSNENVKLIRWTMMGDGLVKLNFRYNPGNKQEFYGINFDYPENLVTGVSWIGEGPYRVWKNRMKGTTMGLWQKKPPGRVRSAGARFPRSPR